MTDIKIIKGNIIHTKVKEQFDVHNNSYLVIENKKVQGIYTKLPEKYKNIKVIDYKSAIIIPSFIDLHIHAPQYMQMGLGLSLELIDWLNNYTFANEQLFSDTEYAKSVYREFVNQLYDNGSLRSCIFATIHTKSTQILVDLLKKKKLSAYVGKVNMNQNAPKELLQTTNKSIEETIQFIKRNENDEKVKPIITPRFAPSCTSELLKELGDISIKYKIPVQTHLAETKNEILWVKKLFSNYKNYSDVYKKHNLYGNQKTLMIHALYLEKEEIQLVIRFK